MLCPSLAIAELSSFALIAICIGICSLAGSDAAFLKVVPPTTPVLNQIDSSSLQHCLQGKRIVFIGPSTSLQDYLALTFFAEYGRWPEDTRHVRTPAARGGIGPNPLSMEYLGFNKSDLLSTDVTSPAVAGCRKGTRETVCRYSNRILNGHEISDCYADGIWSGYNDTVKFTDNRIYHNGSTMIAFSLWAPSVIPPRGTFDVAQAFRNPVPAIAKRCPPGQLLDPQLWSWQQQVPEFLANIIKQAKPTHLVISAAVWPVDMLGQSFWNQLAAAGVKAVSDGGRIYWRTTPKRDSTVNPADSVDLKIFDGWHFFDAKNVIDKKYKKQTSDMAFSDEVHLKPAAACAVARDFLANHVCDELDRGDREVQRNLDSMFGPL